MTGSGRRTCARCGGRLLAEREPDAIRLVCFNCGRGLEIDSNGAEITPLALPGDRKRMRNPTFRGSRL